MRFPVRFLFDATIRGSFDHSATDASSAADSRPERSPHPAAEVPDRSISAPSDDLDDLDPLQTRGPRGPRALASSDRRKSLCSRYCAALPRPEGDDSDLQPPLRQHSRSVGRRSPEAGIDRADFVAAILRIRRIRDLPRGVRYRRLEASSFGTAVWRLDDGDVRFRARNRPGRSVSPRGRSSPVRRSRRRRSPGSRHRSHAARSSSSVERRIPSEQFDTWSRSRKIPASIISRTGGPSGGTVPARICRVEPMPGPPGRDRRLGLRSPSSGLASPIRRLLTAPGRGTP